MMNILAFSGPIVNAAITGGTIEENAVEIRAGLLIAAVILLKTQNPLQPGYQCE